MFKGPPDRTGQPVRDDHNARLGQFRSAGWPSRPRLSRGSRNKQRQKRAPDFEPAEPQPDEVAG